MALPTTTKQQRYYKKNQSSILQKLQNKRKLLSSLPPSLQTRFYCLLVKKENREFLNWTNNIRLVNREILSSETKKKTCIFNVGISTNDGVSKDA
jgi:hypothetical protein